MKIILRKDHDKLGSIGDVIVVKDGYARNYLIPQDYAYAATKGNMHTLEEEKKQALNRTSKEQKVAEKLAAELGKVSVTLQMKVGEDEKLFGSVTSQMVGDALKEKGFEIDKRHIEIDDPIKALGIYDVNVKLHPTISAKVKVWVVRE